MSARVDRPVDQPIHARKESRKPVPSARYNSQRRSSGISTANGRSIHPVKTPHRSKVKPAAAGDKDRLKRQGGSAARAAGLNATDGNPAEDEQKVRGNREEDVCEEPQEQCPSTATELLQLTPEQQALFQSPMVQQGLHPAYVLGMRPPPPFLREAWDSADPQSDTPPRGVSDVYGTARHLLGPLLPPTLAYPSVVPATTSSEPHHYPTASGSDLAINPHRRHPSVTDVVRWPYVPQRTVPGFVYEGAEFYQEPRANAPRNGGKGKNTAAPVLRSLAQFVANTFSTCWIW